jgi:Ca2+-binding EF-hand superfamily protein
MISSIGGNYGFDTAAMSSRIFKTLDTNSDNAIDATELQTLVDSGANLDISQLMADLDTNSDGKIDRSETVNALKRLGEEMKSRFSRTGMQGMPPPPDPSVMFAKADSNSDGGIDQTEFADMGPGDVDQDAMKELFSSIDADGNGTIDEAENTVAFEKMGPPSGGMPPKASASEDSEDTSSVASVASTSSVKSSSIRQLLEALKSSGSDDEEDTAAKSIDNLIRELQNGMVYSSKASMSATATQSLFTISA